MLWSYTSVCFLGFSGNFSHHLALMSDSFHRKGSPNFVDENLRYFLYWRSAWYICRAIKGRKHSPFRQRPSELDVNQKDSRLEVVEIKLSKLHVYTVKCHTYYQHHCSACSSSSMKICWLYLNEQCCCFLKQKITGLKL